MICGLLFMVGWIFGIITENYIVRAWHRMYGFSRCKCLDDARISGYD
jgi:hypothetical protein